MSGPVDLGNGAEKTNRALAPARLLEPIVTMPTFPVDGSVRSLGFGVIRWIHKYLRQPDGDDAGDPFRLTREQVNFVLWFYAIDARGRFVYRRAILRRAKGWGKSPFLGAVCLAELCGPVRFVGWDNAGRPVGGRHPMPWVVVAGVSEAQTENTLSAIRSLLEGSEAVEEYGIDVGLTRILLPGGGKLVPITASSATQEGARPSFAVLDETHHWIASNGGKKLARVIRRNLAKSRDGAARAIETTNAHEPGGDSVAEDSYLAHLAVREGRSRSRGILYDCREAPGEVDLSNESDLRAALRCAYGDATWVDLDRLVEEIYDPNTPPEESRRFYLNQVTAAADSWIAPPEWDACHHTDLPALLPGETVTLGFDGGLTDDASALVAVRVTDGAPFLLGLWEKPTGAAGIGWQVDKTRVRDLIAWAFEHLDPVAFFSDVAYWETDVDAWRDGYGERLLVKATTRHAVAWDMRAHQADTVRAIEALHRAIVDGELPHGPHTLHDTGHNTGHDTGQVSGLAAGVDASLALRRHVLNARRRPNRYGVAFGKETRESPKKVDALAALLLARMARTRVLGENALAKRRRPAGRLVGF